MSADQSAYMMFENRHEGWISPADREASLRLGHSAAPTIRSREQLEEFIAELREVADGVWPKDRS